jgi:hypothetical protein
VFAVAAIGAALAATACTANPAGAVADKDDAALAGDDSAAAVADDGAASCQTGGLPTDTYAVNLQKVGKPASGDPSDAGASGPLTFILEGNEVGDASSPPLEPDTNLFTLKLMDSTGQPVNSATVTLPTDSQALGWPFSKNPWMPLHMHGSSITPTVTNNNDGTYSLSIYFFMAGLWQIYIVAETADGVTDSAEYSFCLQ